jgi:(E)-4-hydroxy-3-methylbut-2-enyl-diphosphate synthase
MEIEPSPPLNWMMRHQPRRRTRTVRVGGLPIGGDHPILVQSMTVADTMDTDMVVREIRELVEAGCPLVRLTAPSVREAENLREIRRRLTAEGLRVPLVADIHFTPSAALVAAGIVEKVRINPGNYADKKRFAVREYTEAEYDDELERVAERFRPLVRKLRENGAALRIGTNHGSLSDRILNRYGDSPAGMVESALEFVRICETERYRDIVLSIKSSVPSVMIAAYRLLVHRMNELGMDYPLHLGVTEAGNGLEGRIKSALGIGALLLEGIGDTIRVSLTEDSRHEIPAARAILEAVERERAGVTLASAAPVGPAFGSSITSPTRRRTTPWVLGQLVIGGDAPVRVEERMAGALAQGASGSLGDQGSPTSEFISIESDRSRALEAGDLLKAIEAVRDRQKALGQDKPLLLEWGLYSPSDIHVIEPVLALIDGLSLAPAPDAQSDGVLSPPVEEKLRLLARLLLRRHRPLRWRLATSTTLLARALSDLCHDEGLNTIGFVCASGPHWISRVRAVAEALGDRPDLLFLEAPAAGPDPTILIGSVLTDGLGDSVGLVPTGGHPWPAGGCAWSEGPVPSAYAILQACRLRLTRAEFIACPSCGRTLFDLQSTAARIRARTAHLVGVKIAVMGCVVNGPGEMADADFGYVGSGPGRVDLYAGKTKVHPNVSEAEAADRLVELIRDKGRWSEPTA